jgi:hypothetical protein
MKVKKGLQNRPSFFSFLKFNFGVEYAAKTVVSNPNEGNDEMYGIRGAELLHEIFSP